MICIYLFSQTRLLYVLFFIDRLRPVWKSWHFCWPWQMHCLQWRISFQASNGWCRLFPLFAFQDNTRALCSFNLTFTQRSPLPLNHIEINVSQHRRHSKRLNTIETVGAEMFRVQWRFYVPPRNSSQRSKTNSKAVFSSFVNWMLRYGPWDHLRYSVSTNCGVLLERAM